MKVNELFKVSDGIYRILSITENGIFAINCEKRTMPRFYNSSFFENATKIDVLSVEFIPLNELSPNYKKIAHERYTMIADIVPVVDDIKIRSNLINCAAERFNVSKQTIRSFLCQYLVYQDIAALAPKQAAEKELTKDQRNMRWALNKFFYTEHQNSLPVAYTMMLKDKYCDKNGNLSKIYPSYNQFRYFYRKTLKLKKYYISRDGLKDYQRNNRPLLGNGVQQLAPCIGTAMLDSTICDIFLVNEAGQLVGRPLLVAACDVNTSLCIGYSLLWEGGTYSLVNLMLNIIADKVSLCKRMGIAISEHQWPVNQLPATMITDKGTEYVGNTFSQITELGVTLINLPSYRPELKGPVEKFFDIIQSSYKNCLHGKGVIMPDFQERGSHDYRKDAVLTLKEFERILVRCIIHYNCERVISNYPYTPEMLKIGILPYANEIWNWKVKGKESNLITTTAKELTITLLPRTVGKFTRHGLKVNKLRYYADGFTEQFLQGGNTTVAYNPDNCSRVWLKEKEGSFVEFQLIETQFDNMPFDAANFARQQVKEITQKVQHDNYQSKIELMNYLDAVSSKPAAPGKVQLKKIRQTRSFEKRSAHQDVGGVLDV